MAAGLTKTQLVRALAEKNELNNKQAAAFLESLADTAIKETKKNGVFVVPGLGRLVKAHRKARVGRNPQTGEPIQIKAKTVVKFRVAKAAKAAPYAAPTWCNLDEVLRDPAINAVYVGTPVFLHAPHTIQSLRAGKHVLCEKPMAMNEPEARSMLRAAEESGTIFGVAYY